MTQDPNHVAQDKLAKRFGHLRSLLHGEPSEQAWTQICGVLGKLGPERADVLPYLEQALKRWPASTRTLPASKLKHIFWEDERLMALIGTLTLDRPDELQRASALALPSLEQLTLKFYGNLSPLPALLKPWASKPALTSLSLHFVNLTLLSEQLWHELLALPWAALNALTISAPRSFQHGAISWRGPLLERLVHVDVSEAFDLQDGLFTCLQENQLPALRSFSGAFGDDFHARQTELRGDLWRDVKRLHLSTPCPLAVLDALLARQATPRELTLDLRGVTARALHPLWDSPCLDALEVLNVSFPNEVAIDGILSALTQRATKLRHLSISGGDATSCASLEPLQQLESLTLNHVRGLTALQTWLAQTISASPLQELHLSSAKAQPDLDHDIIKAMHGLSLRRLSCIGFTLPWALWAELVLSGALNRCERLVLSLNRDPKNQPIEPFINALCQAQPKLPLQLLAMTTVLPRLTPQQAQAVGRLYSNLRL